MFKSGCITKRGRGYGELARLYDKIGLTKDVFIPGIGFILLNVSSHDPVTQAPVQAPPLSPTDSSLANRS
jgi:hypothetical protein